MVYKIKDEPRKLADVLLGMIECAAAPDDLWVACQPDGSPFVARAAEILKEQEAQIEILTRLTDSLGAQLSRSQTIGRKRRQTAAQSQSKRKANALA